MKRISALFLTLLFLLSFNASAQEKYILDPGHSYVLWHISHFGFSHPSGKWMATGEILFDDKDVSQSQVKAVMDLATVQTGIAKLDEHLKTADFFDVAKYPKATFTSTKIVKTGEHTADITGDLNLHGVTKPVTLAVTLNKQGVSPITNKPTMGFTATTTLNRTEFGIDKYSPSLGNEIKIEIEAESYLAGS